MKKVSLMIGLLCFVCSLAVASDIDGPKSVNGVAVMKTGSTFKVFFKSEKAESVKVTIYQSNGEMVYSETLKNVDSFIRPYNFSQLPEGDYTIELITNTERKVEEVGYYNGKVESIKTSPTKKHYKLTRVLGANNKYVLSVSNKGEDVLTIKIYDQSDKLVYNQTESISGDFARIYNLEEISKNFLIEVTDQDGIINCISR